MAFAFEPGSLQQRLGSLPSLSKLFAHGAKTVLPRRAGSLAHLSPDLSTKGGSERNTTLGQLPATMARFGPK